MKLHTTALAATLTLAIFYMARPARADLLLDTGTATNSVSERDAGDSGLGQGVSVTTDTTLTQFAMLLEVPDGGNFKYMIWNGDNTSLLLSDVLSVPASNTPQWILSDPISFDLASGNTYYFGVIQDSNTDLGAPFFFPPVGLTQNGLTTLTSGNSNYEDFLTPVFVSLAGTSLPLQLYGTQGGGVIGGTVPEPSFLAFSAAGLLAMGAGSRLRAKPARR